MRERLRFVQPLYVSTAVGRKIFSKQFWSAVILEVQDLMIHSVLAVILAAKRLFTSFAALAHLFATSTAIT